MNISISSLFGIWITSFVAYFLYSQQCVTNNTLPLTGPPGPVGGKGEKGQSGSPGQPGRPVS